MKRFFVLPFVMFLFLSSCNNIRERPSVDSRETPTPFLNGSDGGILSEEPCGPPCFLGIEPGKTTLPMAREILEKQHVLDLCEERSYWDKLEQREEGVLSCAGILDIRYLLGTEEVYYIRFEPGIRLLLRDVIAKYGFPDFVVVLDVGLPEYPSGRALLYYSRLRMVLPMSEEQEGPEYRIVPFMPVDTIGYLSEAEFQHDLEIFADGLRPWRGYGSYPLYERQE